MRFSRSAWPIVWLAAAGLLLPASNIAVAAPPVEVPQQDRPAQVADLVLAEGGMLRGIVVDGSGIPMIKTEVVVMRGGEVAGKTNTDLLGQFSVSGLRGGVYQVVAGQGGATLRLWDAKAAPPSARLAALVVGSPHVVRGQLPFRKAYYSDAFILTAIVVAAIAIPIGISNARNIKPSSS